MHDPQLAAAGGVAPSQRTSLRLRSLAFLMALVAAAFGAMSVQQGDRAYAFAPPILPSVLPASAAATAVASTTAGAGEVVAVGGTAAAAGATVAAAPVILTAVAVVGVAAAAYYTWKWASGHDPHYASPPPTNQTYGSPQMAGPTTTAPYASAQGQPTCNASGSGTLCTVTISFANRPPSTSMGTIGFGTNGARCMGGGSMAFANYGTTVSMTFDGSNCIGGMTDYGIFNSSGTVPATYAAALASGAMYFIGEVGFTPSQGSPHTQVTTTPTAKCVDAAGNVGYLGGSPVSYFSDAASADLPGFTVPACPSGQTRVASIFPTVGPTGTSVTRPIQDLVVPTITGFPDCNGVPSVCQLNLYRIGHAQTLNCTTSGECADWTNQATPTGPKIQVATVKGGTYYGTAKNPGDLIGEHAWIYPNGDVLDCEWGSYKVETSECTTVPTDPKVDPKTPTGDPTTPPPPPTDPDNCVPSGWAAFNPVEWVLKPVKCALVWAFVPKQADIDYGTAKLQTAWNGTALGTISTALGTVYAPIANLKNDPGPGNCDGPAFVIPQLPTMPRAVTLHPLSTCPSLVQYLLGIYMPIATACIYIGGFFAGCRRLLRSFGADDPDGDA